MWSSEVSDHSKGQSTFLIVSIAAAFTTFPSTSSFNCICNQRPPCKAPNKNYLSIYVYVFLC